MFGLTLTATGSGFDGDSALQGKSTSRLTDLLLTSYLPQSDGESRRCRLGGLKVSSPLGALLHIEAGGRKKKKKSLDAFEDLKIQQGRRPEEMGFEMHELPLEDSMSF